MSGSPLREKATALASLKRNGVGAPPIAAHEARFRKRRRFVKDGLAPSRALTAQPGERGALVGARHCREHGSRSCCRRVTAWAR